MVEEEGHFLLDEDLNDADAELLGRSMGWRQPFENVEWQPDLERDVQDQDSRGDGPVGDFWNDNEHENRGARGFNQGYGAAHRGNQDEAPYR